MTTLPMQPAAPSQHRAQVGVHRVFLGVGGGRRSWAKLEGALQTGHVGFPHHPLPLLLWHGALAGEEQKRCPEYPTRSHCRGGKEGLGMARLLRSMPAKGPWHRAACGAGVNARGDGVLRAG